MDDAFLCQCIADTLDGLRDGLSHFSGPSRAALIFTRRADDDMRIFDPQHLLRGHEPKFKELYLHSKQWRQDAFIPAEHNNFGEMIPEKNLGLAGLVSYGGRSGTVFFQMWFTEHHPDMCHVGPTECWLEHAAWRFSHDLANEKHLYTGISGFFLREYATHAVRDYLVDQLNLLLGMDTSIRVFPVLDAVLAISKTREEKAWPRGELLFLESRRLDTVEFLAKFPKGDQPDLSNFKHVRKLLLSVENANRRLVSDGANIVGICRGPVPKDAIIADFRGGHGFIRLQDETICSFSDGSYQSTTRRAKLVQLEESLLESRLDPTAGNSLYKFVTALVHHSQNEKHGCTIIIDLNEPRLSIPGQQLTESLDLNQPNCLHMAMSLTKVDGALHIGGDLKLHGFACLLDGRAVVGEDRSRGARFNSALRFSAENPGILVVVVSVDRGVSVIEGGIEISAQCLWNPVSSCIAMPPTLAEWVAQET